MAGARLQHRHDGPSPAAAAGERHTAGADDTEAAVKRDEAKKKIEADINELEMSLDQANKSNSEDLKQMKRYAGTLMELEGQVAEEARVRADLQNQGCISERKGHALAGELDEAHMLLDAAERSKKGAEMEVSECRDRKSVV